MVSPFLPDDEKLVAVRAALPATGAGIYLNTGSVGPLPEETHRAMAEAADRELRIGRGSVPDLYDFLDRMDEARAAVAAVIVAGHDSIALTHSTTDGLNIATWAIDWQAGDRIVTTGFEHAGGLGPLSTVRDRLGVELEIVNLADGRSGGADRDGADHDPDRSAGDGDQADDAVVAAFDGAIRPGTKLVLLSHVAWTTGAVRPIRRIVELAHACGALVAVDGAQAAGAIPIDVGALGNPDFYAVPAQKWLLGPEGMAALHVGPAALDRARQTFAGWFSYATSDMAGHAEPWPGARRFEASGYHRPSVLGMARSIGWLTMYVGLDWIHRRGTGLAAHAAARLAAIPGVELLTPPDRMATLVTFRIAGWESDRALEEIERRTFAIARTIPGLDAIRLSVGFFNTEAEIERVAGAVELLAAHTPDSLPTRPALTILTEGG